MLARQALYHLSVTSPTLFALVTFEIGSHNMPGPAWALVLLFVLTYRAEMTGASPHIQPLVELGSHELFVQIGLKLWFYQSLLPK
jgi:hypothetical protein